MYYYYVYATTTNMWTTKFMDEGHGGGVEMYGRGGDRQRYHAGGDDEMAVECRLRGGGGYYDGRWLEVA